MFGFKNRDVSCWENPEPDIAENRIAVHDAQCQIDANWEQLFYQAAWDYGIQVFVNNYQHLFTGRTENEKWEEPLSVIIASAY